MFIDDREWVQKRISLQNYKDYSYVIAFENYESEEFPKSKNAIRAKTKVSGYLLKKLEHDKTILYGIT